MRTNFGFKRMMNGASTIAVAAWAACMVLLLPGTLTGQTNSREWQLVWADEFNVDGAPDPDELGVRTRVSFAIRNCNGISRTMPSAQTGS
jgi:hypothetical protein